MISPYTTFDNSSHHPNETGIFAGNRQPQCDTGADEECHSSRFERFDDEQCNHRLNKTCTMSIRMMLE